MTVVLITGALTGIGRATALAFAKEGDQIVVSGRHGDTGAELIAGDTDSRRGRIHLRRCSP